MEIQQQRAGQLPPTNDGSNLVAPKKVQVKYQLFPFHNTVIKTLSVRNNLLVFGSGNQNDLIKICHYECNNNSSDPSSNTTSSDVKVKKEDGVEQATNGATYKRNNNLINYRQIIVHKVINNRQNFIEWSPSGRYLAVGSVKVSIWQFDGSQFSRFKQFSDELFEVTAFTWCPNSTRYAASGININLSIFVRNIQTDEKIKELKNDHKVLGLIWDPFDKHLAALLASNQVNIYKTASWEKMHIINLNLQASRLKNPSKREDRKIDWSPDMRYLLVPALEDKTVPLVVALDRHRNFTVRSLFMGPFSSINCVKFNPNLYELDGEIINVFATGDNDGNISVWGVGEKFCTKKPFFLLKSHKDENLLIETIAWSEDGRVLFAATFKKYMITAMIDESLFGRKLSQEQKRIYLEGLYGSIRSVTSVQNNLQIFRFQDMLMRTAEAGMQQKSLTQQISETANAALTNQKQKVQYVFTQQKVINTQGKKRIMPAVLVKKTDPEISKQGSSTGETRRPEELGFLSYQQSSRVSAQANNNPPQSFQGKAVSQQTHNKAFETKNIIPEKSNAPASMDIQSVPVQKHIKNSAISSMQESKNKQPDTLQSAPPQKSMIQKSKEDKVAKQSRKETSNSNVNPSQLINIETTKEIIAQLINSNAERAEKGGGTSFPVAQVQNPLPAAPPQLKVNNQFTLKLNRVKTHQRFWRVSAGRCIELESNQASNVIRYFGVRGQDRQVLGSCVLKGKVESMVRSNDRMIVYTSQGYIYQFDLEGRVAQLPMLVGDLHYFRVNNDFDVITINTDCEIKVFNLQKRKLYITTKILPLVKQNLKDLINKEDSEKQQLTNILDFAATENGNLFIQFRNKKLYTWMKGVEHWAILDNELYQIGTSPSSQGGMEIQESLTITRKQDTRNNGFFDELLKPPTLSQVHKLEYSMLFYSLHHVDNNKYKAVLLEYVKELQKQKIWNRLRQTLIDHFLDTGKSEFLIVREDMNLVQNIINLGGPIIQEFKMLYYDANL